MLLVFPELKSSVSAYAERVPEDATLSARGEEYSRKFETVLVDGANGDEVVVRRTISPIYRGALVVCGGGDRPSVRLAVTQAVSALTGLPASRVAVEKWQ